MVPIRFSVLGRASGRAASAVYLNRFYLFHSTVMKCELAKGKLSVNATLSRGSSFESEYPSLAGTIPLSLRIKPRSADILGIRQGL